MKLNLTKDDFDNRLIGEKNKIINNIDDYNFGTFVPPSFKKNVIVYGLHGGAQWPGPVFDPYNQNIYLQVNQIPWELKLYISSDESYPIKMKEAYNLYEAHCASCHRKNRSGNYKTIDEKIVNYIPSLIKIYDTKFENFKNFSKQVNKKHKLKFDNKDLSEIHNLFINWDNKIKNSKNYNENF